MPLDKQKNPNRPLMPSLATTRTAKTPVAPRLAGATASPTPSYARRTARTDAKSAVTPSSQGISTAARSQLGSHVTSRTTTRNSRGPGVSPTSTPGGTPTGTPGSTRAPSALGTSGGKGGNGGSTGGLGIQGLPSRPKLKSRPTSMIEGGGSGTVRPFVRSPANDHTSQVGSNISPVDDKFFHASAAKSQSRGPARSPPFPLKRAATFFHASGEAVDQISPLDVPSPPLSAVGALRSESRHPRSTPPHPDHSPLLSPPLLSKSPEPYLQPSFSERAGSRPQSPSKENIHLSYRKGVSQIIPPYSHPHAFSQNLNSSRSRSSSRRRSSAASGTERFSHTKTSSIDSVDSTASASGRRAHERNVDILPAVQQSPIRKETRQLGRTSPTTGIDAVTTPDETFQRRTSASMSVPQSPLKSPSMHGSFHQQLNELAANARRERKVLDLEISNSSLLAINRQLEREMRKQKQELRRYRRMTRTRIISEGTARASVDPVATIDDSESDEQVDGLGEMHEISEDEEDEEDECISSDVSSVDDDDLSTGAIAERDARLRAKDEKRLELDLSKHRELLVDSQRMNISLKRCLAWTEELIKDGKKAIEYKVRVSDVKLGGRVLTPDERPNLEQDADDYLEGGGLLRAWKPAGEIGRASIESMLTDLDSGIEMNSRPVSQDAFELDNDHTLQHVRTWDSLTGNSSS